MVPLAIMNRRAWLANAIRQRTGGLARILAWATVVAPLAVVAYPWLAASTYGLQDWDFQTAQRYLTKVSLLEYGQAPFWNPYACGGLPAWGYIESATTLVSPWIVPYLALPLPVALRIEILGSGLVGAAGAFAVAGRFTRSHAARAFVVALWAVDSRWTLQAASGHTWHLAYAWMPWCLYFFDRGAEPGWRARSIVALAVCIALMLYAGGMYPLPHTAVALAAYAVVLAVMERSAAGPVRLGVAGLLGATLAAPKLLPMLHAFGPDPRLVASTEVTPWGVLWLALTSSDQSLAAHHGSLPYGWHEYGMYISVAGVVALAGTLVLSRGARGPRERALIAVGALFVVLGLGAFHPLAPWTLLHAHAPFFTSQHVPSRFLYPALLWLAIAGASGLGRWLKDPRGDAAAAGAVLLLAIHIAWVSRRPLVESMRLSAPPIEVREDFHHERVARLHYKAFARGGSSFLSMLANRGVLQCYGYPPIPVGAQAITDPEYVAEATLLPPRPAESAETDSAEASPARIVTWSPNRVVIDVGAAPAGTTVVYNMNYDDGWTSDRGPVVDVDHTVAVRWPGAESAGGEHTVTLVYRPRLLAAGLLLAMVGALFSALLLVRERRA